MSSEDSEKENHSEEQLVNHSTAGAEREVSNSSDVNKLLPSDQERETAFVEEAATENGRDLPSDRGEITNLKENDIEVQSGDKTKEPVDKTDLESGNGNASGKLSLFTKDNYCLLACRPPSPKTLTIILMGQLNSD